jgi:hypothetical protein
VTHLPHSLRFGILATLMLVLLSACYLPDKFRTEIRLAKDGSFALSYYGDLIYAPLYSDLLNDKLSAKESEERVASVIRDLKRDSNFKEIVNKGKARFGVRYERQGRVDGTALATFIRRNVRILSIEGHPDGTLTVSGSTIPSGEGQKLNQLGVSLQGEVRVVTDAAVIEHNASEVRPFGPYNVYIWNIENALSPSPKLKMARDIVMYPRSQK